MKTEACFIFDQRGGMLRPERSLYFGVAFLSCSLPSPLRQLLGETKHDMFLLASFFWSPFVVLFLSSVGALEAVLLICLAQYNIDQKRVGTPSLKQPAEPSKRQDRARVVQWRWTTRVPLLRPSVATDPAQRRRALQLQQHQKQHRNQHQQGRTAKHFLLIHQTRYSPAQAFIPSLSSVLNSSCLPLFAQPASGSEASG